MRERPPCWGQSGVPFRTLALDNSIGSPILVSIDVPALQVYMLFAIVVEVDLAKYLFQ